MDPTTLIDRFANEIGAKHRCTTHAAIVEQPDGTLRAMVHWRSTSCGGLEQIAVRPLGPMHIVFRPGTTTVLDKEGNLLFRVRRAAARA